MSATKKLIVIVKQLMQERKQWLQKIMLQMQLSYMASSERLLRRHGQIVQSIGNEYLISIAAAVLKRRKMRRFKARPRSDHYWTLIKEPRNEELYFEAMRMTKCSFEELCNFILPHLPKQQHLLTIPVAQDKQIAICLYKLASCAEYRVVGDVFGVHKSTVHKYFYIVINAILKLTKDFIRFPDLEECLTIAHNFQNISKIPNIIGAIDGTHIPILPPSSGYLDYVNRKGWPSMVMQAIVDDRYLFRNVNIRFPGSVHDATVFKESGIFKHASQTVPPYTTLLDDVNTPLMLLGDPAYPLLPWLIKPYTGTLANDEEFFNKKLSAARVCVENAFGRLKGRWRCLSKRADISTDMIPKVVVACAILHNFCEQRKELYRKKWNESEQIQTVFPQPNATPCTVVMHEENFDAHQIRNNIKNYTQKTVSLSQPNLQPTEFWWLPVLSYYSVVITSKGNTYH